MNSKIRHAPQRTCVACHRTDEKKTLIRLVRTKDGVVQIDPSGKKPGRGAYLCPTRACWQLALKKNRPLERALRTKLTDDDRQSLTKFMHNSLGEN